VPAWTVDPSLKLRGRTDCRGHCLKDGRRGRIALQTGARGAGRQCAARHCERPPRIPGWKARPHRSGTRI